jgi:hypothetical protein
MAACCHSEMGLNHRQSGMHALCPEFEIEIVSSDEAALEPQAYEPDQTWHPTESQALAMGKLHQLADVFDKTGDGKIGGFRPACRRVLMIGTSGAGKTAVANEFARERGVPLHCVDGGSWIVAGSLSRPLTLRGVRDFIRSCEEPVTPQGEKCGGLHGILYIDETCKLVPKQEGLSQSGWALSVTAEVISLADSDMRLLVHEWTPREIERFRNHFMIIFSGAFQAALTEVRKMSGRGSLGFTEASTKKATYSSEISEFLPEEILSRCASEHIILEAPTRQDIEQAITRMHSELGVKRKQPLQDLVNEAQQAIGGVRWLENYLCRLLVENPYAHRPVRSKRTESKPEPKERSFDLLVSDIPGCVKETNATAAKLQVKLGIIYTRLHTIADREVPAPLGGVFDDPKFGEALVKAIRVCKVLSEVSGDDREEIKPLVLWRAMAWNALTESSSHLHTYQLSEVWVEAWTLAGALIDYRLKLSQAVKRGLIS